MTVSTVFNAPFSPVFRSVFGGRASIVTKCWMPAYGAIDRHVRIPDWTAPVGSTIDFEMHYAVDTGNRYQLSLSNATASTHCFGIEYGNWTWDPASWDVELDGIPITNSAIPAVFGQTYHVKLTARRNVNVGVLGSGFPNGSAWHMTGGLRNIGFTHATDSGLDRYYTGIVRSQEAPTTLIYSESFSKLDRPVYILDGTNDFISIPNFSIGVGESFSCRFYATSTPTNHVFLTRAGGGTPLWINSGNWSFGRGTVTVDGNPVTSGTPAPSDDRIHEVVWTATIATDIVGVTKDTINNRYRCDFPILDMRINVAGDTRFYPMDEGTGNVVSDVFDTTGVNDGTIENYQESSWLSGSINDGLLVNFPAAPDTYRESDCAAFTRSSYTVEYSSEY